MINENGIYVCTHLLPKCLKINHKILISISSQWEENSDVHLKLQQEMKNVNRNKRNGVFKSREPL